MSNQEFTNPEEPQAYEPRNINTDPREQGQGPPQQEPMAGGFYNGLEQQQMGGAKLRPQRRRRRALWFLPILLLVVVLAIGAVVSRTGSFQSHSSRDSLPVGTFTVSGIPTLVIHDDTGVIHIHTGSAGDATIIVNVTRHGTGMMGANGNDMHVNYTQNGNTIDINAQAGSNGMSSGDRSIDLDITTPNASNIQADTGSGTVDLSGVTGQITAESGSGDIHVDNISGQITLTTGSGGIEANHTALKEQSQFKTGSGSIQFEGSIDPQGNYGFETGSGSIDVTLPSNSTFHLEPSTGSGSVNNEFGSNDVGNEPRPTLTLETGSGSINLYKGP